MVEAGVIQGALLSTNVTWGMLNIQDAQAHSLYREEALKGQVHYFLLPQFDHLRFEAHG